MRCPAALWQFPADEQRRHAYVFGTPLPTVVTTLASGSRPTSMCRWRRPRHARLVDAELPSIARIWSATSARQRRPVKGWSVGTGVRWQDKYAHGYPVSRAGATAPVTVDVAHPFWASQQINVDGWLGYQRKIWRDKVLWKAHSTCATSWATTTPAPSRSIRGARPPSCGSRPRSAGIWNTQLLTSRIGARARRAWDVGVIRAIGRVETLSFAALLHA